MLHGSPGVSLVVVLLVVLLCELAVCVSFDLLLGFMIWFWAGLLAACCT